MTDQNRSGDLFDLLRQEAEELVARTGTGSTEFPEGIDSVMQLIHELKVSHAELEIQNEELRDAQLQLESVKEEYQSLYESAPIVYLTLDASTRITRVNASAVSILGRRRPLLVGSRLDGYLTAQSRDAYRAALQRAAASRMNERADMYLVKTGDGNEPVWVQADIRAVVDEDHAVTGWLVTLIDMTDRKRAEEATRRAEEQALLNREVHHRIKNDIHLIGSFLYLEQENADDPTTEDALARARRRVETIQHVYSALQEGAGTQGDVSGSDVLENVLTAHRQVLRDLGGSLETSLSDVPVAAKVALSLGLIANEIITNAEKYAFDGVEAPQVGLVLRPAKTDGGSTRPAHGHRADRLRLVVSDNGRGLPPSVMEQGERGFGLSVVESLAQQHAGAVHMSNGGPDGGARVEVVLKTG